MLDSGPETVRVWPEVESTDSRGNPVRVPAPDDQAITIEGVWTAPISSAPTGVGQAVETAYSVWHSSLPTGPWGRVEWDGREWDLIGEVGHFRKGGKTVQQAVIRARGPRPTSG